MPLVRTYFNVFLDDPEAPEGYAEHRVEVRGADQLRAELEGKKIGVSLKDAMHQTYLWSWAALVREGVVDIPFMKFRDLVIKAESDDPDAEPVPVDPTQPAAIAGLPSASPSPTPATPMSGG